MADGNTRTGRSKGRSAGDPGARSGVERALAALEARAEEIRELVRSRHDRVMELEMGAELRPLAAVAGLVALAGDREGGLERLRGLVEEKRQEMARRNPVGATMMSIDRGPLPGEDEQRRVLVVLGALELCREFALHGPAELATPLVEELFRELEVHGAPCTPSPWNFTRYCRCRVLAADVFQQAGCHRRAEEVLEFPCTECWGPEDEVREEARAVRRRSRARRALALLVGDPPLVEGDTFNGLLGSIFDDDELEKIRSLLAEGSREEVAERLRRVADARGGGEATTDRGVTLEEMVRGLPPLSPGDAKGEAIVEQFRAVARAVAARIVSPPGPALREVAGQEEDAILRVAMVAARASGKRALVDRVRRAIDAGWVRLVVSAPERLPATVVPAASLEDVPVEDEATARAGRRQEEELEGALEEVREALLGEEACDENLEEAAKLILRLVRAKRSDLLESLLPPLRRVLEVPVDRPLDLERRLRLLAFGLFIPSDPGWDPGNRRVEAELLEALLAAAERLDPEDDEAAMLAAGIRARVLALLGREDEADVARRELLERLFPPGAERDESGEIDAGCAETQVEVENSWGDDYDELLSRARLACAFVPGAEEPFLEVAISRVSLELEPDWDGEVSRDASWHLREVIDALVELGYGYSVDELVEMLPADEQLSFLEHQVAEEDEPDCESRAEAVAGALPEPTDPASPDRPWVSPLFCRDVFEEKMSDVIGDCLEEVGPGLATRLLARHGRELGYSREGLRVRLALVRAWIEEGQPAFAAAVLDETVRESGALEIAEEAGPVLPDLLDACIELGQRELLLRVLVAAARVAGAMPSPGGLPARACDAALRLCVEREEALPAARRALELLAVLDDPGEVAMRLLDLAAALDAADVHPDHTVRERLLPVLARWARAGRGRSGERLP